MTVKVSADLNNIMNDMVFSYEDRIHNIGSIFDSSYSLVEEFQQALTNTHNERDKINTDLRNNLAMNISFRKKDFDNMLPGILSIQDEKEKEIRNSLSSYLEEQKELVGVLRSNLDKFKADLAQGEIKRLKEFQILIKEILTIQEERKAEIILELKEFQKDQQEMSKNMKNFLLKGKELRIKDLKEMFEQFGIQRVERKSQNEQRRRNIFEMLAKTSVKQSEDMRVKNPASINAVKKVEAPEMTNRVNT